MLIRPIRRVRKPLILASKNGREGIITVTCLTEACCNQKVHKSFLITPTRLFYLLEYRPRSYFIARSITTLSILPDGQSENTKSNPIWYHHQLSNLEDSNELSLPPTIAYRTTNPTNQELTMPPATHVPVMELGQR